MSDEDKPIVPPPVQDDTAPVGEVPFLDAAAYAHAVAQDVDHIRKASPGSKLNLQETIVPNDGEKVIDPEDVDHIEPDRDHHHAVKIVFKAAIGAAAITALGYQVYKATKKMRPPTQK